MSFSTPSRCAASMMLSSIARLSPRNSAGRLEFARMPPTRAAARNTTWGRVSPIQASTSACRVRSRVSRPAVTSSQSSPASRRTSAAPTMPR